MSPEELKLLLSTPLALFALMLLASLSSALIEVGKAKRSGADVTFASYLSHLPSAVGVFLGNVIAFAVLILTDQLNFAAALGIGYGVNNLVDLLPRNDRSVTIAKQGGFARIGLLVALATFASLAFVPGCAVSPVHVVKTGCEQGVAYRVETCAATLASVYSSMQSRAFEIVTNPATPTKVKAAIQSADRAASPVFIEGLGLTKQYKAIKDELAAAAKVVAHDPSNTEAQRLAREADAKLIHATASLDRWLLIAIPQLNALIAALGG